MGHKKKLVVLGTGFAAVQLVRSVSLKHYDVTVVSPRNYFLFTPLLASTTVGTIEFRSIIEPIRRTRDGLTYYEAFADSIDEQAQTVLCRSAEDDSTFTLNYDAVVIAVGATNNTYGVPGVMEHALFLKDLPDAREIRQKIISCLEKASSPETTAEERKRLLRFVVVGGGPTGVEFAAELHDFIRDDLKSSYPEVADDVVVSLLEGSDSLLGSFDKKLGEYTMRLFKKRDIEVRSEAMVAEVREQSVVLKGGEEITFGALVWSTGIGATPLVANSPFEKDKLSRILVNEYLQVSGRESIYALGDCAIHPDHNLPTTAQAAQQQGKYLARALNRLARGKEAKPFRFLYMGMLAYVGGNRALMDLPRGYWKGFSAWIMWRSIYITKLVSLKNKVLVLFDWFKARVFGRDISKF